MTVTGEVLRKGMPETDIDWVANEGARLSKIHALLKNTQLPNAAHQALLSQLLAEVTETVRDVSTPKTEAIATDRPGSEDGYMNMTVNGTANSSNDTLAGDDELVRP